MLDAIYGPTGADPEILTSVSAAFDHVNKVGTEIETNKHCKSTEKEHTNFEISLDNY